MPRPGSLQSILCNGDMLDQYLEFSSPADRNAVGNASCALSPRQVGEARVVFLQNIDPRKLSSAVSVAYISTTCTQCNLISISMFVHFICLCWKGQFLHPK